MHRFFYFFTAVIVFCGCVPASDPFQKSGPEAKAFGDAFFSSNDFPLAFRLAEQGSIPALSFLLAHWDEAERRMPSEAEALLLRLPRGAGEGESRSSWLERNRALVIFDESTGRYLIPLH